MTVKGIVWLAALLVPVETLPLMACNCQARPQDGAVSGDVRTDLVAGGSTACPHCTEVPAQPPCCRGCSESASDSGNGCGVSGSCCGQSETGSPSCGGQCQCSANRAAPAPMPLSGNPQTENTKTSLSVASLSCASVATTLVPAVLAHSDQHVAALVSSASERLSILCRLVI